MKKENDFNLIFNFNYFIHNNIFSKKFPRLQTFDDFLFLKLFSNSEENEKVDYVFDITYKNTDFKPIDLVKTIDKKTLVNEKIAPGTNGNFNIILNSNKDLKYKIKFQSLNEKPVNLKFKAFIEEELFANANTLEELSDKLTGDIKKNQKIKITINWYWDYENDKEYQNMQDTKDAKNIKKYQFNIYTIGE